MSQKIRMGMVGGGEGAFIGAIHRMAAALDGEIELVCGAFSRDAEKSVSSGTALGLVSERCYKDYSEMFAQELCKPENQRMQFVAIVTPNHLHFPIARAALEAGFHVLSDKPATFDLAEAIALEKIVKQTGKLYALTHTYTGYPLVKQARHMVSTALLGSVRKVVVEYTQGWLATDEDEGSKQAAWRLDPQRAGASCCVGDIGVHAANLVEYICGTEITQLCADLGSVVPGRKLDDDATILLRLKNGARGALLSSQISVGDENNLRIRVYGDKAAIEWSQLEPNTLWFRPHNAPAQQIRAGVGEFCDAAMAAMRTPAGHPEGYIEAFANIYRNFAKQISAFESGKDATNQAFDVPGIIEAVRGMALIENAVAASQSEIKWHALDTSAVPE